MSQEKLSQMLILQLDEDDIEQVTGFLYNPLEKDFYNPLKERLITAYEKSGNQQFQKLFF